MKNRINKNIEKMISHSRKRIWNKDIKKKMTPEVSNHLSNEEIHEVESYWEKYTNVNLDFFKYYSYRTETFSQYYIPDDLYYSKIDMYFNNRKMANVLDNKAFYDKMFPNLYSPYTPIKKINGIYYDSNYNVINFKDLDLYLSTGEYIMKPSLDSQGGKGIFFFKVTGGSLEDNLVQTLFNEDNYIIQEIVSQHSDLKKIHPSSLNTIRVISLFYKNEVYTLSSVLRVGISGSKIDNASSGGIVIGISNEGKLKKYAYSVSDYSKYEAHPDTAITFEDYKIPYFNEILDIVKAEAKKLPNFQMVSWDFAVDSDENVVFIEANLKNGQLDFHQLTNGPLFKDMTDTVLEEVFRR
ncbi:sugar-transfer associated ATP-grasp domain-containing protein [Aerococcus urinaeequi]|uniref:sugar-transfer associated ATP-grasp domain-containing protein n=1 Tax=Aerococcus urinaeequi TaxID=51665 RepID=UPI003ED85BD8